MVAYISYKTSPTYFSITYIYNIIILSYII